MQLVKGVRSILEQPQVSLTLSLTHTHTHTHSLSLSLSLSHAHTHTLSLSLSQALADTECYHEFCRLMMRLKSNYQLGELMRLDDYPRLIELIAKFTVSSLQVNSAFSLNLCN